MTMCMQSDFEKWVAGELIWSRWDLELVPIIDEVKTSIEEDEGDYLTYEQFSDGGLMEYEIFEETYQTPKKRNDKSLRLLRTRLTRRT